MTYRGEGKVTVLNESGSHYGHCILEIKSLPFGSGIVFENKADENQIPLKLTPSVEKGIIEGLTKSSIPFRDMCVCLVGGSWTYLSSNKILPVSTGMSALQDAARLAIENAKPRAEINPSPFMARSLGWQTHLIFPAFEGEIKRPDDADYLAVRTPENPTHHWGNFLLFDKPPQLGDLPRWEAAFAREIGPPETSAHKAFGWDTVNGENGDSEAFIDAGYSLNDEVILAAQATDLVRPVRFNEGVEVRALTTERELHEWQAAFQNQIDCRGGNYNDKAGYRIFKEKQFARYRRMTYEKRGNWYGAFLDGRLVGDCGLFWTGDKTLARFQAVGVHPDFRRRGICGAMLWRIAREAFAQTPDALLVIVADANSPAQAIYQSLGFQMVEKQMSLEKTSPSSSETTA